MPRFSSQRFRQIEACRCLSLTLTWKSWPVLMAGRSGPGRIVVVPCTGLRNPTPTPTPAESEPESQNQNFPKSESEPVSVKKKCSESESDKKYWRSRRREKSFFRSRSWNRSQKSRLRRALLGIIVIQLCRHAPNPNLPLWWVQSFCLTAH
jgi:hypothetical protein